ncbi:unnamed protein product [Thlaspi arvense]|uniref:indole-3-acetaldehyde oxidase n=1 Tax=Thlaspi arvense TaxID=13288 RepID=A0AAU9SEJ2_THLAR|nr:unnamed protein product [Thlaspi arvense]
MEVNGERFKINSADPSTTLLEFLRFNTPFKSVKLGGCGACLVVLSKYNPELVQVEECSINSCLTLLCSINGCSITTSEGLGNTKKGFHPIQKRLAGFHASQCGFCTPGMCISLYSALANAHHSNSSGLTASEAEKSVAGNLCRCTGYRPIVDACKSFASDVDIEDLGFNSFWRKGESKEVMLKSLPPYNPKDHLVTTFPEFLKKKKKVDNGLDHSRYHWTTPLSVVELYKVMEFANSGDSLKLVVGNTGTGYYRDVDQFDRYVDISHIPEMSKIQKDEKGIEIGAAVTISKAIDALNEESKSCYVFKKMATRMEKIGNHSIRNSGSIGGNLVMAQSKKFPSDITTLLLAADASVYMLNGEKTEKLKLLEFLELPPILDSKRVLLKVEIPSSTSDILFESYRASPRSIGNALPYLSAAFFAHVSRQEPSRNGVKVDKCLLAFGSYGSDHSIRATEVEKFLTGKFLSYNVLCEAVCLLRGIIVPGEDTSHPEYRKSLAVGFLFDFFYPIIESSNIICSLDPAKSLPFLSSSQHVVESNEFQPVGEAVIKVGAALQASGEAVFVDDIPTLPDCLHGAFIYSTEPLAKIKSISFSEDVTPCGVFAVLTFKDLPQEGQNIGSKTIFGPGPLFADELTRCAGQRIALVVADTQKHADMAAKLAVIEYDTTNLELPILTVEDAVKRSSFFDVYPMFYPEPVGDVLKGMKEAEKKIILAKFSLGSQYHFYMEPQTALALPDEDNCVKVFSSSQAPEYVHSVIATCLGIQEHNVRVITRRVGGGFGGKAVKSMPVATACALAAHKLQRAVKMYLNRKTDMIMAGGRHPMKVTYNVGFRSDGKLTALELTMLIDAGIEPDVSPIMPRNIMGPLRKYDWGALSFDVKVCKTNLPSRTAMRAPGEVQGSYIAESIIENVASSLGMDVDAVRKINLHSYSSLRKFYKGIAGDLVEYSLPLLWDKLEISSEFNQRSEMVKKFNKERDFSSTDYPSGYAEANTGKVSILSDGSVVVEVGGIEIGQGLWTKVQQMSDTLGLIQGGFTAGSTTSENSCEAVKLCCIILVERLKPLMEKSGSLTWNMLIQQAYAQSVNLSASTLYKPEFTSMEYLNYGVGVEVDLLTGRTEILRSDIIYDCGKSLNPAVDLGQVEGAFVQGIGFFMMEEYTTNEKGLVMQQGTWDYKIPTVDTIPKQFHVEILNTGHHKNRVLSSKASGEPPLLLAASVHCATRSAIREARKQFLSWNCNDGNRDGFGMDFELPVPATMPVVKGLCGLYSVNKYLEAKIHGK